jgi:DNA end-binding protein Ku
MQSLWKGTLSFGLIALPVRLYSAVEDQSVRFHFVHAACRSRVRQKLVCEAEGVEVERRDLARAYEEADGSLTLLGEDDVARNPSPEGRRVEVLSFTAAAEVNPLLLDRSYYLTPEPLVAHAFAVLRRALLETEFVGVARLTLHGKERLCLIHPLGPVCALTTLFYTSQLREPQALATAATASEAEVRVARNLLETFRAPFEPEQFQDERRRTLLEAIAERRVDQADAAKPPTPTRDIMAALRASLAASGPKKRPRLAVVAGRDGPESS